MKGRTGMRIVVVRHGQAKPKKGWAGSDEDRPLTSRGRRQAERLVEVVGARPDRILSSPALRCRATVEPLAERYGIPVAVSSSLSTDAGPDAAELVRKLAGSEPEQSTVVVCTHREAMVMMLPDLARESGRKLGHRPPGAKGGAWLLGFEDGRLARIEYRPPAV